jgi:hypothetical protein
MTRIRDLNHSELHSLVDERLLRLDEDEALAVLDNRHCSAEICTAIAQSSKLTSFYSVRARLVSHRATPMTYSLKFVRHLFWNDLLRMSVDVRILAPVRRAIDQQLLGRLPKLTIGERVTTAKSCSRELIRAMLFDPDAKVFRALLINPRLSEDTLIFYIGHDNAGARQISLVADDRRWKFRPAIREAILKSPNAPKSVAASQIPHLPEPRLREIARSPELSTYLKVCIDRQISR